MHEEAKAVELKKREELRAEQLQSSAEVYFKFLDLIKVVMLFGFLIRISDTQLMDSN